MKGRSFGSGRGRVAGEAGSAPSPTGDGSRSGSSGVSGGKSCTFSPCCRPTSLSMSRASLPASDSQA